MHAMKLSAIALAVTAGASQLALANAQSEARGLMEDSTFEIFNRNLYFNRDFQNNTSGQSKQEEWAHGITATFESGFTPGLVRSEERRVGKECRSRWWAGSWWNKEQ